MEMPRAQRMSFSVIARIIAGVLLLLLILAGSALTYLLQETAWVFEQELKKDTLTATDNDEFPVGIDPVNQVIVENPDVETYLQNHFAADYKNTRQVTWFGRVRQEIASLPWYQGLASPSSRILVIYAGERKEEVAYNIGSILGWSKDEREYFLELMADNPLRITEGVLYPGRYVVTADATPEMVAKEIQERFAEEVLDRYPSSIADTLPLEETLIIASLIEREARTFSDMRDISGVIWKRLFTDMRLQLDASLQYARGSRSWEREWWPIPRSRDKFIDSPYNTYLNEGLPPGPIANPSAAAIIAALNPTDTDCFFYFHDRGDLYCSTTYEEHVDKLKALYGTGR